MIFDEIILDDLDDELITNPEIHDIKKIK